MHPDPIAASLPLKQRKELERELNKLRKRKINDQLKDGPIKKARPGMRKTDDVRAIESQENVVDCNRTQVQVHSNLIIKSAFLHLETVTLLDSRKFRKL